MSIELARKITAHSRELVGGGEQILEVIFFEHPQDPHYWARIPCKPPRKWNRIATGIGRTADAAVRDLATNLGLSP